jgi:cytoskeletal protein RodZ
MAGEPNAGDFGSTLRAARERRGVSLQQIAKRTKISVAVLEALERNDIERLPGGLFSRAFVRSYAFEVGLDPEATIQRFVDAFPEASAAGSAHAAEEQQEEEAAYDSSQRTASAFVRLIVISVPIVALLLYFGMRDRAEDVPAAPAASPPLAPALPAAPPVTAPTSPEPPPEPTPAKPPGTAADRDRAAADTGPAGARGRGPAPAPPVPEPLAAPPPDSAAAEPVKVAVVATAPCWVSAIVDGERVVSRELQAGERVAFEVGRSVVLTAGDAAALAVTINGADARPLGAAGQVVTVRVTPDNYKEYLVSP